MCVFPFFVCVGHLKSAQGICVQVEFVLKSEWSDVRQRPFRFAKTPKCLGCLVYSLNSGKRCVHFYVYVKTRERCGSCVYLTSDEDGS